MMGDRFEMLIWLSLVGIFYCKMFIRSINRKESLMGEGGDDEYD